MAFGVGVEHKGESEADKNNPANAKLAKLEAADHAQEGIAIKKRSMTDCLWVFLIIGLWVVMTSIGAKACANGNPSILLYPSDYRENICGHTGSVKENHYAYIVNKQGEATCVEECPSAEPSADAFLAASAVAALGGDQTQPYIDAGFLICKKLEDRDTSLNWQQSIDQGYCSVAYKSSPIMYYCVFDPTQLMQPEDGLNTTVGQYYGLPEGSGAMSEFVSDLTTASGYIFGLGVCLAFLVSIVFTYVLTCDAFINCMVWGSVFGVFVFLAQIAVYTYTIFTAWQEEVPMTHTKYEMNAMYGVAGTFGGLTVLWFVLICCIRQRIQLAIEIVQETASAVRSMSTLIFLPLLPMFGLLLFMVPWMFYMINMSSQGMYVYQEGDGDEYLEVDGEMVECDSDPELYPDGYICTYFFLQSNQYESWFMLFAYFWTSQFLVAITELIIALAFCMWYFTRDKEKVTSAYVVTAFKWGVYYHAGTAAFGSFIIAVIKLLRAVVAYVQNQANKSRFKKLAQCLLCCIGCCLWCIEKCMRFLNKNAYIQTAIHSVSFCTAAKNAFFLILRNITRIGALSMVSGFILMIGKVFICVVTSGLSYMVLNTMCVDEDGISTLNSPAGPMLFIMILSYFIAMMFTTVFDMGNSTVLQCFIYDCEENSDDASQMYASADLIKFVNTKGKYEVEQKKSPADEKADQA